ncbi:MAG: (d)CMP kinase [Chitinophagaceae bacterium]
MKKIVVAVDGLSSTGKSSMAKALAKKLGYTFIDSGAMYRAITLYFLRNNIDIQETQGVIDALTRIELRFDENNQMCLNGENVAEAIRTSAVSNFVSPVSALEPVRTFAVAQQQAMGELKGIVMDGRDIGTTVFPQAELKLFLMASEEVRCQRRYLELVAKEPDISMADVRKNLLERDYIDTHREISPLRKADDAIELDNSNLSLEETIETAYQWVMKHIQD